MCGNLLAGAQANKKAKMAAVFIPGYYINHKNDTVRGQVQINPEDPTEFYNKFAFIAGRSKKPKMIGAAQTKAYGFEGRHFVSLTIEGQKFFVERLTSGRLRFLEYRHNGKVNGNHAVESEYFIRDLLADEERAELKEPKKISTKFYKKSLKPYMEDQPMIWADLNKYTFDRNKVIHSINEFNRFYVSTGN
jgi:hypothetical protein